MSMLVVGTIAEEDCDSLIWPEMEIEITSNDKGRTANFFSVADHSNALFFLTKTLLKDKKEPALSNTTKSLIRRAIKVMKKSKPTNPTDSFITRDVTDATLMAKLFTKEEDRKGLLEYITTHIEEDGDESDISSVNSTELFLG